MVAAGRAERADPVRTVAFRITHRALDAGIAPVGTADARSAGVPEETVDKALKGRSGNVRPGTDHIDLHQVHLAGPDTDVAEAPASAFARAAASSLRHGARCVR